MAAVQKWAADSLFVRYLHQLTKQLAFSAGHPVQGWYITAAGGGSILNADAAMLALSIFCPSGRWSSSRA